MWDFGYQRGYSWEDQAAEGITGIVILAGIFVAAVAVTVFIVLVRELLDIFRRQAFQPTLAAKILWVSLGVLLLLYAIAGLLATKPAVGPYALYVAAWGTLLFVVVAEYLDLRDGRDEERPLDQLDTYLGDFTVEPSSVNGHQPAAVR